jgi:hypothetical protein
LQNTEDQASLLGIATSNRAALSNYRSGKPIGTSRDQYERVGHLLGIHKNLRLLFPHNRELAYRWMTTRNKAFDNQTPVEVVKGFGWGWIWPSLTNAQVTARLRHFACIKIYLDLS